MSDYPSKLVQVAATAFGSLLTLSDGREVPIDIGPDRLSQALVELGFEVCPSQANFVWCRHHQPVKPLYEELKRRLILVRYMNYPGYGEGLRISVGTDEEINRLLEELKRFL